MTERADPACGVAEHRSSDWALDGDRTWQCGICQPPTPALVKGGLVIRRNGGDEAAATPVASLTDDETRRLVDLEFVINRGLQTFVEVGTALAEIRDRRLYRASHATFEVYCRERWGFGRTRAHRLIEAADMAATLPMGNMPANERVARELAPLKADPERMREAWAEAVEASDGQPTAKEVRETVKRRRPAEIACGGDADWMCRRQNEAALKLVTTANAAARRVQRNRDEIVRAIEHRHGSPRSHDVEVLALNLSVSIRDLQRIADLAMGLLSDEQRRRVEEFLRATETPPA